MPTLRGARKVTPKTKALKSRTSEYTSNPILKAVPPAPKKRNAPNYKVPSTPKVSGRGWGG